MGMVGVERENWWEWMLLSVSTDGNGWCSARVPMGMVGVEREY